MKLVLYIYVVGILFIRCNSRTDNSMINVEEDASTRFINDIKKNNFSEKSSPNISSFNLKNIVPRSSLKSILTFIFGYLIHTVNSTLKSYNTCILPTPLSITLPNNQTINNVIYYDDIENYENQIIKLLPRENYNFNTTILNGIPHIDKIPIYTTNEVNGNSDPTYLNISRTLKSGKKLILNSVLTYVPGKVLLDVRFDNKNAVLKIFGSPKTKKHRKYFTEISQEILRHIFVNAIDMSIGPEIYNINKDEKDNIFMIMEKVIEEKKLKKNPEKWIRIIYKHINKLHERNFHHTDPSFNLIGSHIIDFSYIEQGGLFFKNENEKFDIVRNDIQGFANALYHKIYLYNIKEDEELWELAQSYLYGLISKEEFLINTHSKLIQRNKSDRYSQLLTDIIINKNNFFGTAQNVLINL